MRIRRSARYDAGAPTNTFRTRDVLREKTMKTMTFGSVAILAVVLFTSAPRPADAG